MYAQHPKVKIGSLLFCKKSDFQDPERGMVCLSPPEGGSQSSTSGLGLTSVIVPQKQSLYSAAFIEDGHDLRHYKDERP